MAWKEMDEADWLTSTDGLTMYQQDLPWSTRQGFLVTAACLRRSEPFPGRMRTRVTVEDVERLADGLPSGFDPVKDRIGYGIGNADPGFVMVNASLHWQFGQAG